MFSLAISLALAAIASITFPTGTQAYSGQICTYLQSTDGTLCSQEWLFSCYSADEINGDGSANTGKCIELSEEGIYSYKITDVEESDSVACDNYNPLQNSIAWFYELFDDTDCSGAGATYVWTDCDNTDCVDISSDPAYYLVGRSEIGSG